MSEQHLEAFLAAAVAEQGARVVGLSAEEAMLEVPQGPVPLVLAVLTLGFSRRVVPTKRYYRVTVNQIGDVRSVDVTTEVQRARASWGG